MPGLLNSLARCWMRIGALAVSLAACGPVLQESPAGPDVPRISNLELVPYRVIAGCPTMVLFHFEDLEGDVKRAVAHWTVTPYREHWNLAQHRRLPTVDSGTMRITVQPETFAGKTSGEVQSRLTIVRPGRYLFHVQVEDMAGHRSNVLKAVLVVDEAWAREKNARDC